MAVLRRCRSSDRARRPPHRHHHPGLHVAGPGAAADAARPHPSRPVGDRHPLCGRPRHRLRSDRAHRRDGPARDDAPGPRKMDRGARRGATADRNAAQFRRQRRRSLRGRGGAGRPPPADRCHRHRRRRHLRRAGLPRHPVRAAAAPPCADRRRHGLRHSGRGRRVLARAGPAGDRLRRRRRLPHDRQRACGRDGAQAAAQGDRVGEPQLRLDLDSAGARVPRPHRRDDLRQSGPRDDRRGLRLRGDPHPLARRARRAAGDPRATGSRNSSSSRRASTPCGRGGDALLSLPGFGEGRVGLLSKARRL